MLNKQPLTLNFAKGLDTKTDPKQVQFGNFLSLQNTVFEEGGLLKKRNGFGLLSNLPDTSSKYFTTLNGNLTAIGNSIAAYSSASNTWVTKGTIQPAELNTLSLIKNNLNQVQADSAVSDNGLVCTAYTEQNDTTYTVKYAIANATTGQNIIAPTEIPVLSGTPTGSPRVFVLGKYFIVMFTNLIGGTSHLSYIAINTKLPTSVTSPIDIANSYSPFPGLSWDAVVTVGNLYIAYNTLTGGQAIKVVFLSSTLVLSATVTYAGEKATNMSVTADNTSSANPQIYVNYLDSVSGNIHTLIVDKLLNPVLAPSLVDSGVTDGVNITSIAQNGYSDIYYEVTNSYSYDGTILTNYINSLRVLQDGTPTSPYTVIRSVGLASKAFLIQGTSYFLSSYQSDFQSTYFLINASLCTEESPIIVGKLAYGNGGGYLPLGLPNVSLTNGNNPQFTYLVKDLVQAVNKNTNVPAGTQVAGIYTQTGINLATFTIGTQNIETVEVANDLHISGGFLWLYDGYLPVEHSFFLYPDSVEGSWSATGGNIAAKPDGTTNTDAYFYQVTYEWSDNQGNIYRSAPSIPISITTTGAGTTGSITLNVPTLRVTYKIDNPVKIVIYRWSVAQEAYYQVTSITSPILNDTTVDQIQYVDTLSDADILGNNLLYTTGGVVENVAPPATKIMTIFDTRLWLVDAENPNLLGFSKTIVQNTPVEMSDLFTYYVAPNEASVGPTGPITALAPMDDKLIVFKENAIYFINGVGPNNTGGDNQYSKPIFVTSTVGCTNQHSIIIMPMGIMFQSSKGIWLLGRDLSTKYIGADVEEFNNSIVQSSVSVPATNEVRFTLNTGEILMYDYYYQQWGTFVGASAISSCIFENKHTLLDKYGRAMQETPGIYLDGSKPVLISFTTSWLHLASIQGYQRLYEFQLLGTYLSPHKLQVDVAFDFRQPTQRSVISPINFTSVYGADSLFGQTTPFGGPGNLEQWRVFANHQQCQAFQITLTEVYDASYGVTAAAGFDLSGITCVLGIKKGYRPIKGATSVG